MSECQTYGDIIDCKIGPGGHALVYFQEVGSAAFARQCLYSKLTSDETDTDDIEDCFVTSKYAYSYDNECSDELYFICEFKN